MTIRFATIDDLPDLRALWQALGKEEPRAYPLAFFARPAVDAFTRQVALALTNPDSTVAVLLALDPAPAGFLLLELQERSIGEPIRFIFVHWLFVLPGHRDRGIGNSLVEMAAEFALSKGLTTAEITYNPSNSAWDHLGFTPFEVRAHSSLTQVLLGCEKRRLAAAVPQANGHDIPQVVVEREASQEEEAE